MLYKHIFRHILLFIFIVCACARSFAQKTNTAYQAYIDRYSVMAIDQMKRYHIPASITLAQGLLESRAGLSTLATKANNHFGIKTGGDWTGPYVLRDDDARNEHFRQYKSAWESFEDHSIFLQKPRYARLFTYDIKDYKSWAKGLKACGYATSPTYAEQLINIIETYRLYEYDEGQGRRQQRAINRIESHSVDDFFTTHPVGENNKNYYIRLLPGDDLDLVARETGVSKRKLLKYNDLPKNYTPSPGSIIYLQKKRSHADRGFKHYPHTVTYNQSMYDIAQMYGIKLKSLYKMNKLPADYAPNVGDVLRVY